LYVSAISEGAALIIDSAPVRSQQYFVFSNIAIEKQRFLRKLAGRGGENPAVHLRQI
jgi:hypothetical protein